jgi:hypothetical protein
LTGVLATRWPETPPQGWRFAEVKPHLTVAYDQPTPVLDEVEASITTQLPIAAAITAVRCSSTMAHADGSGWPSTWPGGSTPHPGMFRCALERAGSPRTAHMVGDNPTADVQGA